MHRPMILCLALIVLCACSPAVADDPPAVDAASASNPDVVITAETVYGHEDAGPAIVAITRAW